MGISKFVYFGQKFSAETDGVWGYLVDETRDVCATWEHVVSAIVRGDNVQVRQADAGEIACAESNLLIEKVSRKSCAAASNYAEGKHHG